MAHWRSLETYTPFGRTLVEYMWAQRPPLLPAQFAARMGVRKQALSSWLSSDATPPPQVVMRLARAMGLPVADLLIAAGHATAADPLMDTAGAWELALATARTALARARDAQEAESLPADLETLETLERVLSWMAGLGDTTTATALDAPDASGVGGAADAHSDGAATETETSR